jgi:hypothetical protein
MNIGNRIQFFCSHFGDLRKNIPLGTVPAQNFLSPNNLHRPVPDAE